MPSSQPENGSTGGPGLSLYVQMLLSFGKVPKWHNFLSTLLIWMITTGFIIIPSSLIQYTVIAVQIDGLTDTELAVVVALIEPLYVLFIFTAFPPSIL
jgi:hypothetical protein